MYLGYYAKEYYPNPDINLNDRYIIEEFYFIFNESRTKLIIHLDVLMQYKECMNSRNQIPSERLKTAIFEINHKSNVNFSAFSG